MKLQLPVVASSLPRSLESIVVARDWGSVLRYRIAVVAIDERQAHDAIGWLTDAAPRALDLRSWVCTEFARTWPHENLPDAAGIVVASDFEGEVDALIELGRSARASLCTARVLRVRTTASRRALAESIWLSLLDACEAS